MYFEQFYLGCLAHASYMLGSEGEAAAVDPQRDVEIYLKSAEEQKLKIRHIFETHLHADFVSGHKELAARTGAEIYIGAKAGAAFRHVPLRDGFELKFGKIRIKALETPGHTPESTCLVITDEEKSTRSWAVLTGDTLFIGDVGRPDLSKTYSPQELAGMLYESLHKKLLALPDDVLVYPAHGAGSLCGRNMRAERSSTIGAERLTNYALQIRSRDEFIRQLTSNLPARPEYFLEDAEINREGAAALTDLAVLRELSPAELKSLIAEGVPVLDVRREGEWQAGHIADADWWPLDKFKAALPQIVTSKPLAVHCKSGYRSMIACSLLRRAGYDNVINVIGGFDAWQQAKLPSQVDTVAPVSTAK